MCDSLTKSQRQNVDAMVRDAERMLSDPVTFNEIMKDSGFTDDSGKFSWKIVEQKCNDHIPYRSYN